MTTKKTTCYLCEESSPTYRGCTFGKKERILCPKCMAQFRAENGRVVLRTRKETNSILAKEIIESLSKLTVDFSSLEVGSIEDLKKPEFLVALKKIRDIKAMATTPPEEQIPCITNVVFVSDVKELLKHNPDVRMSPEIQKKLDGLDDMILVQRIMLLIKVSKSQTSQR